MHECTAGTIAGSAACGTLHGPATTRNNLQQPARTSKSLHALKLSKDARALRPDAPRAAAHAARAPSRRAKP